jgi:hypothetical protein
MKRTACQRSLSNSISARLTFVALRGTNQLGVYHMADLDIEIKGQTGKINALTFKATVIDAISLLRDYDRALSGVSSGSLSWYLSQLAITPNVLIGFRSHLKPAKKDRRVADFGGAVASSLVSGLDSLEHKGVTPPYLSVSGMERIQHMVGLIGQNGATGFRVSADQQSVDLTPATGDNIGKLLPVRRTSIGSVEGKLEGINLHAKPRVIIYHAISKRAVTCDLAGNVTLDRIKELLGCRVVALGILHKNVNGDTLRMTIRGLFLPEELRSRTVEQDAWAQPEFASAASTAEYLRRIRGGG